MTKSSKNLWARFLFQDKGILPGKRLLIIYSLLSGALLLLAFTDISWIFLISVNVLFILASFFDLLFLPKRRDIVVNRDIENEMERGLRYQVSLEFKNNSANPCSFRIIDDLPQSFHNNFPVHGGVKAKSLGRLTYETIATVRGKYELNKLYIRYTSRFGLWERQMAIKQTDTVKVIPDLTETRHYLANAQQFLLYEGLKIRKKHSGEGEFSRVRNYVIGDDPRKINWRQTAKLQEVMANEYEPEHGKYITILIDCGRMMGAELEDGNRLEKTLEASITVAAAALKNDDYVGVLAFSNEIKVFVPPEKGMNQLQKILQSIYHLQADTKESNYALAMSYLQTAQKKSMCQVILGRLITPIFVALYFCTLYWLPRCRLLTEFIR